MSWSGVQVDPGGLDEAVPPTDPDIGGEGGASEVEEIERQTPAGSARTGGPSGRPLASRGGQPIDVLADFEGLGTRDVVRGVDLDDSGNVEPGEIFFAVPSDAQLGVGTEHVVEVINSEVGIFEKSSGDRRHHFRLEDWFAGVLSLAPDDEPAAQFENIQVFDPRVRYDPAAERFVIACVEFNLPDEVDGDAVKDPDDLTGAYLLSVSSSGDPMDSWTNYRIPPLQGDPPKPVQGDDPTRELVDFPQLGFSDEAVYLTQNFFAITAAGFRFTGSTMEVLDKDDLYDGRDVHALHFTGLRNPDGSLAFTVQPTKGADHLLNTRFFHGDSLAVWTVTDPLDPDAIAVTNDAIRVRPYNNPPAARQPGTEERLDMGDTRIGDAVAYDGAGNLWATHTVNDGSVRWYEIDPTGPAVVQTNTFKQEGLSTFYPVVETNGDSAMVVFNVSGPKNSEHGTTYAGIEVAGRTSDSTPGQMESSAVVRAGESTYDYVNAGEGDPGSQTLRWGDYNGIQVDPDDGSYWVVSQYANDPDTVQTFGTRIANVSF